MLFREKTFDQKMVRIEKTAGFYPFPKQMVTKEDRQMILKTLASQEPVVYLHNFFTEMFKGKIRSL